MANPILAGDVLQKTTAATVASGDWLLLVQASGNGPAEKVTVAAALTGATKGTVILNGATPVTVANTAITANSVVVFTLKTVGGTVSPSAPNVITITPGTGFTVGGTALDTSTYNYAIL